MSAGTSSGPSGLGAGGGECGALLRARDWGSTPLGPIDGWPRSLKTATSICLESRYGICVFWGPDLVAIYVQLAAADTTASDEPRSKVVLLALAKILGLEESFSREWRFEERMTGQRLPRLIERLAWTVGRMPGKQSGELSARIKSTALGASTGDTSDAFVAVQTLMPRIETSSHPEAALVIQLLQGTRQIEHPHRPLLILLALAARKVLLTRR